MRVGRITDVVYRKLSRLYPSQYFAMTQCAYKIVLAEAFDRKALLPLSPNAYMGAVLHKLIELITKGKILDEQEFNLMWEALIQEKEAELSEEGNTFCLPLRKNVLDIGLKKIQARNNLKPKRSAGPIGVTSRYLSEKWLQDEDGKVGGKADLIIEKEGSTAIYDFKTGKITLESTDEEGNVLSYINEGYDYQLKLYAHLYFLNKKQYPTHLYLVDLNRQVTEVSFSADQCKYLYDEAICLLAKTNARIEQNELDLMANSSVPNCRSCLYRPACQFYKGGLGQQMVTDDVIGIVQEVKQFLNGNINVRINVNDQIITIAGIDKSLKDFFENRLGQKLEFYNLRKEEHSKQYIAAKYSCLYEAS